MNDKVLEKLFLIESIWLDKIKELYFIQVYILDNAMDILFESDGTIKINDEKYNTLVEALSVPNYYKLSDKKQYTQEELFNILESLSKDCIWWYSAHTMQIRNTVRGRIEYRHYRCDPAGYGKTIHEAIEDYNLNYKTVMENEEIV